MDADVRVTTVLLWRATVVLSIAAVPLLFAIGWLVSRERFAGLRSHIVGATFVVWFAIWMTMVSVFWQRVYSYFFVEWLRWFLPVLMGTGFAVAARILWSFAGRSRRAPAAIFVLLGAALGPLTHSWAVFRGLVTGPPMLQGVSPLAAVAVSTPEFALYFSAILALSILSARVTAGRSRRRRNQPA